MSAVMTSLAQLAGRARCHCRRSERWLSGGWASAGRVSSGGAAHSVLVGGGGGGGGGATVGGWGDEEMVELAVNIKHCQLQHNSMESPQPLAQSKLCKYKLRNNKRTDSEDESIKVGPKKRGPKPRLRSAGMSRYRRKEANARERQRQGEINTSFDRLREKIPHPGPSNGKCEKLRKIDILRVSIMYIRLVQG